ncbi:MAG: hypothetical protein OER90_07350 [Gemmatimonadota bacterium]|nr:hypothetical protein [Gemmatimonadota bacterium]
MSTNDPVGTAVASIGAGATSGAAVMTAGVLLVRLLQRGDPHNLAAQPGTWILGSSVFLGLAVAATTGWLSTRAIPDTWRRGVTAALCVFGAVLLAVVATAADMIGGAPALSVYAGFLVVAAGITHGIARRAARR